ncbi:MAG: acyl-CoA desaturase [Actinomycetota bacterium]
MALREPMTKQQTETPVRGVVRLTAKQLRFQRRVTLAFTVVPLVAVVAAMVRLWGWGISGLDLVLFLVFYSIAGTGISVGFHRLFTHRAFKAVRPLQVALAYSGQLAIQGGVIDWCATHRRHHAFADEYGDPHSPHLATAAGLKGVLHGLWFAHVGWLFDANKTEVAEWGPDLVSDRDLVRVNRRFPLTVLASFLLPPLVAFLITFSFAAALSAFLWASLVRIFLLHHVTWSINSICHFYGKEAYQARDESKNVWPLAPISFGESWHNNHHAFPWSARLGLKFWQIDTGWYTIRALQGLRLIRDVKVPTRKQLDARSLKSR